MPLLDVSEALDDPLFQDTMQRTTRTVMVGDDGIGVETTVTSALFGVVTTDKGRNFALQAEGARVVGSIMIHTRTRVIPGGTGVEPDLITWDGNAYTVVKIDNYSRYGAGFICAYCDLRPLDGGVNAQ